MSDDWIPPSHDELRAAFRRWMLSHGIGLRLPHNEIARWTELMAHLDLVREEREIAHE